MESKAAELLAVLKNPNHSIESKIAHLANVKSDIKQKNVPESAVPSIFESLRLSIASQHFSLLEAGFSTLGHFLKRLSIQDQHDLISSEAPRLYNLLLERLGDHKDRVRAQAAQAFTGLWPAANAEVEHYVLGTALVGRNARAREMSLIWLCNMTKTHGLRFRAYVPSLVSCLEDADSAVRETAKTTVLELFQNAPDRAKTDLKKQLVAINVRRSISNAILVGLGLSTDNGHSASRPASRAEHLHHRPASAVSSRSEHRAEPHKKSGEPAPAKAGTISSKRGQRRPSTGEPQEPTQEHPDPSASTQDLSETENPEPLIITSAREIDEMVHNMLPHFEGRESEGNWLLRQRDVYTLRRLTRGNAPQYFSHQYLAAIKSLLDGIFKVVTSLRTTASTTGCVFIQDLARICRTQIDPMVEIMMQNLLKVCSSMKKITAQAASTTVDVIIENVTYTSRILQHVSGSCQDKNVQLRLHGAGWLKTLISKQAGHTSSLEHNGGVGLLEKSIKSGLSDANPGVREKMRVTFWVFFDIFPQRADEILSGLDTKSRSLLEKASSKTNVDQATLNGKDPSRKPPASGTSATSGRSGLKEAIAAHKKAHRTPTKAHPPRPESAQSAFSEVKARDAATPKAPHTIGARQPVSSLSSAPVRPAMKPRRPELARPATADPHARPTQKQVKPKKVGITKSHRALAPRSAESTPSPENEAIQTSHGPGSAENILQSENEAIETLHVPSNGENGTPPENEVPETLHIPGNTEDLALPEKEVIETLHVPGNTEDSALPKNEISQDLHAPGSVDDSPRSEKEAIKTSHAPGNAENVPTSGNETVQTLRMPGNAENIPPSENGAFQTPFDQRDVSKSNVLEELHTDGPGRRDNRQPQHAMDARRSSLKHSARADDTNGHDRRKVDFVEKRRSISQRSKDPQIAREMIDIAIDLVRKEAMDIFGYRKLQGLIEHHNGMFGDEEQFSQLLIGLLEAMEHEAPDETGFQGREMDLRVQILATIRTMFRHNEKYFSAHYPRVLPALVKARKNYESKRHIVKEMEDFVEDIASVCDAEDVVVPIVDSVWVEKGDEPGYRAARMAVFELDAIVRQLNSSNIPDSVVQDVGAFGKRVLLWSRQDIRRLGLELCLTLHRVVGPEDEAKFWNAMGEMPEVKRSLLFYYLGKK